MTEQKTEDTGMAAGPRRAPRGTAGQPSARPWEWAVVRSGDHAVVCRLVFATVPPDNEREAA